ncbi:MAG TPA: DUF3141 domain-containing protein [Phycisphaerae bacterium]|nr:DUF3141 domain-containing protein [Phycisphaerae bacterium]
MSTAPFTAKPNAFDPVIHGFEYAVDAFQRSILFWDVLRQRGNNYLDHKKKGQPPILQFEYETIIDGRTLEQPVNYALLRIKPEPGKPTDPRKRPYVIVDPRAGHGPGIGGSKHDSQVGVALRAGHPVYFVTFFPEPMSGQKLRDVAAAEAHFIEEVARRHPNAQGKPCVVGNCQAGWAVAALAAVRPDIMGPVILNGAPLSYWGGASGQNPMRYAGGLLGGKWLESMACDLGDGLFDGAHLVSNFENLDPANTFWKKYYNLYSKIDTEAPRFLGFETWWGGYFLMNREEIDAIVSELFIGNKLATGRIASPDGKTVDLRNIRSPIVVFASQGDNITPPQQALNWIEDVYGDEQAIIANDQVIVYMVHEDIGHLGIFVSGRVAAKEHKEMVETLEMIDALPAGLYEMIIERKDSSAKRADLEPGDYLVRFEARKMDDIRSLEDTRKDEEAFQTVEAVSEVNDQLYKTFVSPWVQAMSPPWAETLRNLHPLRTKYEWFSDRNPLLAPVSATADVVRENRLPVKADNPFLAFEKMASEAITSSLDAFRDLRDTWSEGVFKMMYGPLGFGAIYPPKPRATTPAAPTESSAAFPDEDYESGGPLAAVLRMIAAAVIEVGVFDRRSARVFRALLEKSQFKDTQPEEVRTIFKQQARLLRQNRDRALEALAVMLPTREVRRLAVDVVRQILLLAPDDIRVDRPLAKKLSDVLDMNLRELPESAALAAV